MKLLAIVVMAVLLPPPASSMPITTPQPTPSSEEPSSDLSRMSPKVVFDIVFGLGLFFLTFGACIFVASGGSFTWFNGVIDRTCIAFDTLGRYISPFRLTSLFARTGNAIAGVTDANNSSTRNGGGEVPTV